MMLTKGSFALIFIFGFIAAATASLSVPSYASSDLQTKDTADDASHNLIVGARVPGDRLLSQQIVTKSSGWLQVQTLDVTFKSSNYEIITQVRALDQKTNGNGAHASITNGGPGNSDVTVHFKSKRGHSIKFILEIYGR